MKNLYFSVLCMFFAMPSMLVTAMDESVNYQSNKKNCKSSAEEYNSPGYNIETLSINAAKIQGFLFVYGRTEESKTLSGIEFIALQQEKSNLLQGLISAHRANKPRKFRKLKLKFVENKKEIKKFQERVS